MFASYNTEFNKIGLKIERTDDFQKTLSQIKEFLQPLEWNDSGKLWLTEKMNLLVIPEIFPNYKFDYICQDLYVKQKAHVQQVKDDTTKKYEEKIDLIFDNVKFRDYQLTGINFLLKYPNTILGDEQGLGKTLMMIATISALIQKEKITKAIVICPKSLKYNWVKEINLFSSLTSAVLEGSKEQKIQQLLENKQVYITNFDSLATRENSKSNPNAKRKIKKETIEKSKKFQKDLTDLIDEKTCVILDEAHRIKNGSSKVSKTIRAISKSTMFKYAMTGTPIANKPQDIFYIMKYLDGGKLLGTNYSRFLNQYCILGPNPYSDKNALYTEVISQGPITVTLTTQKEPIVGGYGLGLRTRLLGYFVRADWAWGVEDGVMLPRVFYLSLGLDF